MIYYVEPTDMEFDTYEEAVEYCINSGIHCEEIYEEEEE